jgi:predicted peptidase
MAQTSHQLTLSNGTTLRYLLHLPDSYAADSAQQWPFILFLHGRGERGTDVEIVRNIGLPNILDQQPDFPCVILSPQCPNDVRWPTQDANIITLLDTLLPTLRLNPQRVYLSGLSMGGEGAWYFGACYPERFAAVVPVCARIPLVEGFPERVSSLKDKPLWAFHGDTDNTNPTDHTLQMISVVKNAGGSPKLTIFPNTDHDCWGKVYNDTALWEWLLGQSK